MKLKISAEGCAEGMKMEEVRDRLFIETCRIQQQIMVFHLLLLSALSACDDSTDTSLVFFDPEMGAVDDSPLPDSSNYHPCFLRENFSQYSVDKEYNVDIAFHVLRNSDSPPYVQPKIADFYKALDVANSDFRRVGINFNLTSTELITNESLLPIYGHDSFGKVLESWFSYVEGRINKYHYEQSDIFNVIDVYFIPEGEKGGGEWLGYAFMIVNGHSEPWVVVSYGSDSSSDYPGSYIGGDSHLLSHELGHSLGLLHSFSTDGIGETFKYKIINGCGEEIGFDDDGYCMIQCQDYEPIRTNLMDYSRCNNGKDYFEEILLDQKRIMSCFLETDINNLINP